MMMMMMSSTVNMQQDYIFTQADFLLKIFMELIKLKKYAIIDSPNQNSHFWPDTL